MTSLSNLSIAAFRKIAEKEGTPLYIFDKNQ
ncbi:MAG: hypothetical protein ACD_51C00160G0001, partial [uncultured bacterium]